MQAMTKMANLTIFRQRPKFRRMSLRQGYQQSSEVDEYVARFRQRLASMCLANLHAFGTLTKFCQICHIRQNRQINQLGSLPCIKVICIYLGIWQKLAKFVTVMTVAIFRPNKWLAKGPRFDTFA